MEAGIVVNRDQLAKLEAAATPGPWEAAPDTAAGRVWIQRHNGGPWNDRQQRDCEPLFAVRGDDAYEQRVGDAALIVAARNHLPELLRRLDLAEQALAAAVEDLESAGEFGQPCTDIRVALAAIRAPFDQPEEPT